MSRRAPTSNRARFDGATLVLPAFSLFNSGSRSPWKARVVATHACGNGVVIRVEQNRTRTKWWASASKEGFRMSNTATTGSPAIGEKWIAAVKRGDVRTESQ